METEESPPSTQPDLMGLPDEALDRILLCLDVCDVEHMQQLNRSSRDQINNHTNNLFWFNRVKKILGFDLGAVAANLPCWDDDFSGEDWKSVAVFYEESRKRPLRQRSSSCYCEKLARDREISQFREHLENYISRLAGHEAKNHWKCMGKIEMKPELLVPAAGIRLTVPLEPTHLRILIRDGYCERAPFSRGAEAAVDTGNCWQLSLGKDVIIGDNDWNSAFCRSGLDVNGVLHHIEEKLAPSLFAGGDMWAQPYSIRILEEGDSSGPYRDTIRGPGHIGSLHVMLPVKGGSTEFCYRLTNKTSTGDSRKFCRPPDFRSKCKYVAFCTNVFQEVLPVTSGYRVTLCYHLWAVPRSQQNRVLALPRPVTSETSISVGHMMKTIFSKVLTNILKDEFHMRLAFALDHSYGQNLSPRFLRGRDKYHYQMFRKAAGPEVHVGFENIETKNHDKFVDRFFDLRSCFFLDSIARGRGGGRINSVQDAISRSTFGLNMNRLAFMDPRIPYEYQIWNDGIASVRAWMYQHWYIVISHTKNQ